MSDTIVIKKSRLLNMFSNYFFLAKRDPKIQHSEIIEEFEKSLEAEKINTSNVKVIIEL